MPMYQPQLDLLDLLKMEKYATAESLNVSENVTSFYPLNRSSEGIAGGPPASFAAQVTISVFIVILGIWSALGNLLTILAIAKNRYMRTKCNYFILSLAVSDLISGTIASPLWLYRRTWGFQHWSWGEFLCKFFWFVDESTSYCTAMHIASFAVWRYIGVRWPHAIEKFPKRKVKIWLFSIWAVAITFGGALFSMFYSLHDRDNAVPGEEYARWPSCTIKIQDGGVNKHLVYYTFSSATFMLTPMLVLFASSILIVRELFCHTKSKSRIRKTKERKAVCQLALISSSFLLGYVPMTTYVMWTTRTPRSNQRLDYWCHVAAYFTLRISECLNPIIYNIASENMRKASRKVLHWIGNCCRKDAEVEFVIQSPSCRRQSLFHFKLHTNSQDSKSLQATIPSSPSRALLFTKSNRLSSTSSVTQTFTSLQVVRSPTIKRTAVEYRLGQAAATKKKVAAGKRLGSECTQV